MTATGRTGHSVLWGVIRSDQHDVTTHESQTETGSCRRFMAASVRGRAVGVGLSVILLSAVAGPRETPHTHALHRLSCVACVACVVRHEVYTQLG